MDRLIGLHGRAANLAERGAYRIAGTVTVGGNYASRRVTLFEYPTFRAINQTWSDPITGAYTFERIKEHPSGGAGWGVYAVDHNGIYDPETKLNFPLEAMP
jgi:hypothetical protein